MNRYSILTAVFSVALAVPAAAQIEFDGTSGGKASLAEAINSAAPDIAAKEVKPSPVSRYGWVDRKVCGMVELDAADGAAVKRRVPLKAVVVWEECKEVTIKVDGQYVTVTKCEEKHRWYTAFVDLVIHERQLRQFDKERVEVCYDFEAKRGSFALRQTPFEYGYRDKSGDLSYTLELFPGARRPQDPAAGLVELKEFSYDDVRGEFTLTIHNRFSPDSYGRKLHLGVELVQDKMFDSSKGVKFYEFPIDGATGDFKVVFKQADFASEKEAEEFRAKASKYFVNWGFKVKGEGFTDAYIAKGKTGTVQVLQ